MASFLRDAKFEGDNLSEWFKHFKIEELNGIIEAHVGVIDSVSDFLDIVSDLELMTLIKTHAQPLTFKKFAAAIPKTSVLEGVEIAMPLMIPVAHPAVSGQSTTELRKEVSRQRKEIKEKEDLVHALANAQLSQKELDARLKSAMKRQLLIKKLENNLKQARSLDLLFLLDCTGSMTNYIKGMKEKINKLVDEVKDLVPDLVVRLGFIGYRDHCDGDIRLAVHRFSTDVDDFKNFVKAQKPTGGGGDGPEDIAGALKVASGFEWESHLRIMVHVGDYPCHGDQYHNIKGDSHPRGDPYGIRFEDVLPIFKQKEVKYFFGKILDTTDKMIMEFNKIYGYKYIVTLDAQNADGFMEKITTTISSSVSGALSGSKSTHKIDRNDLELDGSQPRWAIIKAEPVLQFETLNPMSIEDLVNDDSFRCLQILPSNASVKVASKPFAAGACRMAIFAVKVDTRNKVIERAIHKVSLHVDSSYHTRERFETDWVRTHVAASFLANEFNKVKPRSYPAVTFATISLLQFLARPNAPHCLQEQQLDGDFEKYNDNTGVRMPNPTASGTDHTVIQAFSHWTYHITNGHMMVVDCQGVFNAGDFKFILTDPAIHCTNMFRFGSTNLHMAGFRNFAKTHRCNECCKSMRLPELNIE